MKEITLEELLEAGCHFGHQVTRQNPKARDYIFEARDNIHIIDLAKTKEGLDAAAMFIKNLAQQGKNLLIVGTKRQAQGILEEEVKRVSIETGIPDSESGLFYITNRWVGGIMTNFAEISKNIKKLKDLIIFLQSDEEKSKYTKREVGLFDKKRIKLESFYRGIAEMKGIPDAIFIVDTHLEDLAVREANATGVTIVGITDTNADPTNINYPIPANDDAVGSIKLIINHIINAWIEGKKTKPEEKEETEGTKETKGTEEKKQKKTLKKVKSEVKSIAEPKEVKEAKNGKRKPRSTKKTS